MAGQNLRNMPPFFNDMPVIDQQILRHVCQVPQFAPPNVEHGPFQPLLGEVRPIIQLLATPRPISFDEEDITMEIRVITHDLTSHPINSFAITYDCRLPVAMARWHFDQDGEMPLMCVVTIMRDLRGSSVHYSFRNLHQPNIVIFELANDSMPEIRPFLFDIIRTLNSMVVRYQWEIGDDAIDEYFCLWFSMYTLRSVGVHH